VSSLAALLRRNEPPCAASGCVLQGWFPPAPRLLLRSAMATIYTRPEEYDLEHGTGEEDVAFYQRLVQRLGARRVVELGCGSGRITVPLAELAAEQDLTITGVDVSDDMLEQAEAKLEHLAPGCRARVRLQRHDIRTFVADPPVDTIIVPCSTLAHVLELEDQLQVWRAAYASLVPGGRFVVDLTMPNLNAYADSMASPPRALVEMDIDQESDDGVRRLIRYKTTRYEAHRQRAYVHFLYDRFEESHVYFPRELQLLFLYTGFEIEATYGDYRFGRLTRTSCEMVMVGRRPG
jgi:SAM-dependent methyltransferase